jgi:hypothetical protein
MDSTEFKLPECMAGEFPGFDGDGTKSCTQLQFEYDILSGKINDFCIGDARMSDHTYAYPRISNIQKKELIIRDLGYSRIDSFIKTQSQGGYYISRLHPQINLYEKKGDSLIPLSLKMIFKKLQAIKGKYLDLQIYIGREAKHPVRLTVNRLTSEAIRKRLQKKIHRKNKNQEKYQYLSKMNLFITNVPKEILAADAIYGLYKIRWQIELIFKTWKSVLNIDKVRKMKAERFKCYLLGKLLWILVNWEIYSLFNETVLHQHKALLSHYKCFSLIKNLAYSANRIFFRRSKLNHWLRMLYEILSEHGLKENRKGRVDLVKLLALKGV